jgi:hypothetical protein
MKRAWWDSVQVMCSVGCGFVFLELIFFGIPYSRANSTYKANKHEPKFCEKSDYLLHPS